MAGGSSGFYTANLQSISLMLNAAAIRLVAGDEISLTLYVRNAAVGSGKNSGLARLWYNDEQAKSRFDATVAGVGDPTYQLDGFALGETAGLGLRKTIDVPAGAKGSPFKVLGTWTRTR